MDRLSAEALLGGGAVLGELDLSWWLNARAAADVVAIVLHLVFVLLGSGVIPSVANINSDVFESAFELQILVAMSAITLFFHVVYLTGITRNFAVFGRQFGPSWMPFRYGRGPQERNTLKWLEYSISATLGTVAVAYSDSCNPNVSVPPTEIVVFLIFVAITEQTTGYTWDSIDNFTLPATNPFQRATAVRAFITTALCQGGEFAVLWLYRSPDTVAPWATYVAGWTSFGIWAALRYPSWGLDRYTNRVQLSELFYSLLSTASKISLFAAIVFSEDWEGCGARR